MSWAYVGKTTSLIEAIALLLLIHCALLALTCLANHDHRPILGEAARQILQRGLGQGQSRWEEFLRQLNTQPSWRRHQTPGIRCFNAFPGMISLNGLYNPCSASSAYWEWGKLSNSWYDSLTGLCQAAAWFLFLSSECPQKMVRNLAAANLASLISHHTRLISDPWSPQSIVAKYLPHQC